MGTPPVTLGFFYWPATNCATAVWISASPRGVVATSDCPSGELWNASRWSSSVPLIPSQKAAGIVFGLFPFLHHVRQFMRLLLPRRIQRRMKSELFRRQRNRRVGIGKFRMGSARPREERQRLDLGGFGSAVIELSAAICKDTSRSRSRRDFDLAQVDHKLAARYRSFQPAGGNAGCGAQIAPRREGYPVATYLAVCDGSNAGPTPICAIPLT